MIATAWGDVPAWIACGVAAVSALVSVLALRQSRAAGSKAEAATRPVLVFRNTRTWWDQGGQDRRALLVQNAGRSAARDVRATIKLLDTGTTIETSVRNLGPDDKAFLRLPVGGPGQPAPPTSWERVEGELHYTTADGLRWQSHFKFTTYGGYVGAEQDLPTLADSAGGAG